MTSTKKDMARTILFVFFMTCCCFVITGCGGGGNGEAGATTTTSDLIKIHGYVSVPEKVFVGRARGRLSESNGLHIVEGVTVKVYHINNDGTINGNVLGFDKTDDSGFYYIHLPADTSSGNLIVSVDSGSSSIRSLVMGDEANIDPMSELILSDILSSPYNLSDFTLTGLTLIRRNLEGIVGNFLFTADQKTIEAAVDALDTGEIESNLDELIAQTAAGTYVRGTCGDRIREVSEACDDGNTTNNDGCSSTCVIECGDGQVGTNEKCDDGNTANGDGCSSTCQWEPAVCGNSVVENTEGCDDGNTTTETCTYGQKIKCKVCNQTCQEVDGVITYCGDGTIDSSNGEVCDDGNSADNDGCSSTCKYEYILGILELTNNCANSLSITMDGDAKGTISSGNTEVYYLVPDSYIIDYCVNNTCNTTNSIIASGSATPLSLDCP